MFLLDGASRIVRLEVSLRESFNGLLSTRSTGLWDQGFIPTSVIQGNLPPFWGVSLWEALFVVLQRWSFPTALLNNIDHSVALCVFLAPKRPQPWSTVPKLKKALEPSRGFKEGVGTPTIGECSLAFLLKSLQTTNP